MPHPGDLKINFFLFSGFLRGHQPSPPENPHFFWLSCGILCPKIDLLQVWKPRFSWASWGPIWFICDSWPPWTSPKRIPGTNKRTSTVRHDGPLWKNPTKMQTSLVVVRPLFGLEAQQAMPNFAWNSKWDIFVVSKKLSWIVCLWCES